MTGRSQFVCVGVQRRIAQLTSPACSIGAWCAATSGEPSRRCRASTRCWSRGREGEDDLDGAFGPVQPNLLHERGALVPE
jgi:hypothetical protein